MKVHKIIRGEDGLELYDNLLIVRYPEGDCDTFSKDGPPDMGLLKRALYDEREMSDKIAYEDEFELDGAVFSIDS